VIAFQCRLEVPRHEEKPKDRWSHIEMIISGQDEVLSRNLDTLNKFLDQGYEPYAVVDQVSGKTFYLKKRW
jgi:predicted metalloenzyme YecM